MATKAKGGKKGRKVGRSKRKGDGRQKPLSRFVRGVISAETYFKLTKHK